MGVYQPLELMDDNGKGTGLYHYTCTDGGGTHAIGHCSPIETCPECKGHSWMQPDANCPTCASKGYVTKANPCPGHPTSEEAIAHYREYLLDNARYDGRMQENEMRKCEICGTWTQGVATVGDYSHDLCDGHRNRAGLEQVAGKYGD